MIPAPIRRDMLISNGGLPGCPSCDGGGTLSAYVRSAISGNDSEVVPILSDGPLLVLQPGGIYVYTSGLPKDCTGHLYKVHRGVLDVPSYQQKVLVEALTGKDTGLWFVCSLANFSVRYRPATDQDLLALQGTPVSLDHGIPPPIPQTPHKPAAPPLPKPVPYVGESDGKALRS